MPDFPLTSWVTLTSLNLNFFNFKNGINSHMLLATVGTKRGNVQQVPGTGPAWVMKL